MNTKLLYCFLLSLLPFFGYSQPIVSIGANTPDPVQGGSQIQVAAVITNATAFTTYTVTVTCTGCTPQTKDLTTNMAGVVFDPNFFITLPEIDGTIIVEAVFFGLDCTPCNATSSTSTAIFPVELVSFEAKKQSEQIQLEWATASEVENSHFDILHSKDGRTFEKIGQAQGMGTTDEWTNYGFTHRLPLEGTNYYQLKQVDYNGQYELSEIIVFNWKEEVASQINIYPNPAAQHIDINSNSAITTIQIIDSKGQIIQYINQDVGYQHHIDLNPQLSNGIYILKIDFENGEHLLEKLFVRR